MLEIKDKYFTRVEWLFMLAVTFEIVAQIIELTTIPYMYEDINVKLITKMMRYMGYLLAVIKITYDIYEERELYKIILLVGFLGFNSLFGGRELFMAFIFIYAMKDVDFEVYARFIDVLLWLGIVFVVGGSVLGIIDNWGYDLQSVRPRYAMGYYYPSHATSCLLYATMIHCYVRKSKLTLIELVLISGLTYWEYTKTDSRAGTALIFVILIVFYLLRIVKGEKLTKKLGFLLACSFIGSAIFSVLAVIYYDRGISIFIKLDSFLSNRLMYAANSIKRYGIHLLGNKIEWIGNGGMGQIYHTIRGEYNFVDCSYLKILLEGGVLLLVLVVVAYTMSSVYVAQNGNIYLSLALAFVATYSIIEPRLCEIGFNPFIMALVVLIENKGSFILHSKTIEDKMGEDENEKNIK